MARAVGLEARLTLALARDGAGVGWWVEVGESGPRKSFGSSNPSESRVASGARTPVFLRGGVDGTTRASVSDLVEVLFGRDWAARRAHAGRALPAAFAEFSVEVRAGACPGVVGLALALALARAGAGAPVCARARGCARVAL